MLRQAGLDPASSEEEGIPRVFIHGWGQAPSVWSREAFSIAEGSDLLLTLPGHGGAPDVTAAHWLDWLADQLPAGAVTLVGWSLGAMLALQLAARLPQRVRSLTLFAATPCFCVKSDWPHGVESAQLKAMEASVRGARRAQGLARFTRLMLHGEGLDRRQLRQAMTGLQTEPLPTAQGLMAGLTLLRQLDLRQIVANIAQPVQLLHGEEDAVVPLAAGQWLADALPNATGRWIPTCGHMPWRGCEGL
ncbi:MAG: alpha/beta fold hydrolase [Mariprofundales bacterium]